MRKSLIFLSIFIVALIAFVDAKDRIEELDEVAANTPAQVEMKQTINPITPSAKKPNINNINPTFNQESQKLHQKMIQDSSRLQEKFNNVQERRKNITTPTN